MMGRTAPKTENTEQTSLYDTEQVTITQINY